jgi:lipoate-protein ligase A
VNGRLIIDEPLSGPMNMALDERLLEAANAGDSPVLRLYSWTPATLSLGYFQSASSRRTHESSLDCPLVRRASGGGAIVHDRELTYALVLGTNHRWAGGPLAVYAGIHDTLIDVLSTWGIQACRLVGDAGTGEPPFLCFLRRSTGDVVAGGVKVAGSAQRRQRGGILIHGSILLDRSEFAPELDGLRQVAGRPIPANELGRALIDRLASRIGVQWSRSEWTGTEWAAAAEIARKYVSDRWNLKRP